MRGIPVNLNSTLVILNSSLVSLNSTPVSLSIVGLCGLRLGYIFIGLGISGLYGTYVSWNMRAIPGNLHKIPVSLNSTPVSLENTLPVAKQYIITVKRSTTTEPLGQYSDKHFLTSK